MALQDFDKTRQYTRYKRHVDESHEKIDAGTVNKIQDDIVVQQVETNGVKDTAFEERVYTIFNNNLYTNAMFLDCLKTGEYIDMNSSRNIEVTFATTSLGIKDVNADPSGRAVSTVVYSPYGSDVEMNDFFLIANEEIPVGASIKYYLVTNLGNRWPITPNALKLPMHLTEPLKYGFSVMIEMQANSLGEMPKLNGYAVLYWDAAVEDALGLTNPDLKRFP